MGAGHDGAARELKQRLEADGHYVEVADFLEMAPFRLMHAVRWIYEAQLRFAPWSYQLTYKLWILLPFLYGPLVGVTSLGSRRRMKQAIDRVHPDVVVSTYCLSTLVLGRMRRKKWLRVPAVTFLTDFAVHPLCVHPGVDLTLAVSAQTATEALEQRAAAVAAPGPLVPNRFSSAGAERVDVRDRFGIPHDQTVALVVAGSWGVGEVIETVEELAAIDGVHPVTVCGKDETLRNELESRRIGTVIGWTNEMDALMGASDVIVENAGGLTCMEAFRVGVPVVTYRPIPGHGVDNARHMHAAGVNRFVESDEALAAVLKDLHPEGTARAEQVARATALFSGDAAADVVGLAGRGDTVVTPFRRPRVPRILQGAAVVALVAYVALTFGAQTATARGMGVAHAPKGSAQTVFVGVRLDGGQIGDATIAAAVKNLGATAIVDARTAERSGPAVDALSADGIDIANGGWGKGDRYRWNRARSDVARASSVIQRDAGERRTLFVPGRRIDGFDLMLSRNKHQRIVRADHILREGATIDAVHGAKVYIVDGRSQSPDELAGMLAAFEGRIQEQHLTSTSLSKLS